MGNDLEQPSHGIFSQQGGAKESRKEGSGAFSQDQTQGPAMPSSLQGATWTTTLDYSSQQPLQSL